MFGGRWKAAPVLAGTLIITLAFVPTGKRAHAAPPAPFDARGSIEQVDVTHAVPGSAISLHNAVDATGAPGTVDDLVSFLFRDIVPGDGYTVVDGGARSAPLHVM